MGADLADEAKLGALLDRAVAVVRTEGLDGFSFTTDPLASAASAAIVAKLAGAVSEGQLLVFEGNPLSLTADDRARVDYVVLNTERTQHVQEVRLMALNATGFAGIEPGRLLLAADIKGPLYNEDRVEFSAADEMPRRVIEFGPLGGVSMVNIGPDYYNSDMNFRMIRRAIQTLNPAK